MTIREKVLQFWFQEKLFQPNLNQHLPLLMKLWFGASQQVDQQMTNTFKETLENHTSLSPTSSAYDVLADIILLDQFPRNIFRNTPQAFSFDAAALSLAL